MKNRKQISLSLLSLRLNKHYSLSFSLYFLCLSLKPFWWTSSRLNQSHLSISLFCCEDQNSTVLQVQSHIYNVMINSLTYYLLLLIQANVLLDFITARAGSCLSYFLAGHFLLSCYLLSWSQFVALYGVIGIIINKNLKNSCKILYLEWNTNLTKEYLKLKKNDLGEVLWYVLHRLHVCTCLFRI